MQLQLRLENPDPAAALSLRAWLRDEQLLRRHGELLPDAPAGGQLGPDVDVIGVLLSTGLSVAQLVFAVAQWRQSRPGAPAVTVTRTGPNGVTVRIESADPAAVAEAVRALEDD